MNFRMTLFKLTIFLVVSGLLGSIVYATLDGPEVGDTDTYHATFSDVTGLHDGDPVRVSGVSVGLVESVTMIDARHVDVEFTANRNQTLTTSTYAVVRYANLLGQRFLALTQDAKPGTPLHSRRIAQDHTRGALSLTALFNGFRPLFAALDAGQINKFSTEIIQVLQGESGTIEDLFRQTAQLTSNLANRDDVFLSVVDNLGGVLRSVAAHDTQLGQMVDSLSELTRNLARDTPNISRSIDSVNQLTTSVNRLMTGLNNGDFTTVLGDLQQVTSVLAKNTTTLDATVKAFPNAFADFNRITQYGNWINAYPCSVTLRIPTKPVITPAGVAAALKGFGDSIGVNLGSLETSLINIFLTVLGPVVPNLSVPLEIPDGPVTTSPQKNSAVC